MGAFCDPMAEADVRIGRRTERGDQAEIILVVSAMPGAAGHVSCALVAETNQPDFALVRIPIELMRASDLVVRRRLDPPSPDGSRTATLVVVSKLGRPFKLTATVDRPDLLTIETEQAAGGSWTIRVRRAGGVNGVAVGSIALQSDIEGEPAVSVPVALPAL